MMKQLHDDRTLQLCESSSDDLWRTLSHVLGTFGILTFTKLWSDSDTWRAVKVSHMRGILFPSDTAATRNDSSGTEQQIHVLQRQSEETSKFSSVWSKKGKKEEFSRKRKRPPRIKQWTGDNELTERKEVSQSADEAAQSLWGLKNHRGNPEISAPHASENWDYKTYEQLRNIKY